MSYMPYLSAHTCCDGTMNVKVPKLTEKRVQVSLNQKERFKIGFKNFFKTDNLSSLEHCAVSVRFSTSHGSI